MRLKNNIVGLQKKATTKQYFSAKRVRTLLSKCLWHEDSYGTHPLNEGWRSETPKCTVQRALPTFVRPLIGSSYEKGNKISYEQMSKKISFSVSIIRG
jgi:hypothetical protein